MNRQELSLILGTTGLSAGCVTFTYIFIYALLSGGSVTININSVGEMWYEFALILFFIPFMVYTMWYVARG